MKRLENLIAVLFAGAIHWTCLGQPSGMNPISTNSPVIERWSSISNRWGSLPLNRVKQAAEHGDVTAGFYLGNVYFDGIGVSKDENEAVKWIKKGAIQGYAKAQNYLGVLYLRGEGVPKDPAEAVKWYRKAAEQGEEMGESNLGWMYGHGVGVQQDYELAEKWMRLAAEQGNAKLQLQYGELLTSEFSKIGHHIANYEVAAEWFRKAADQDYAPAQYKLAELYHFGKLGDDQRSQCIPWYLKAAAHGNTDAQATVGELNQFYPNSELLKSVNIIPALRQSAEKGNFDAQFQLAKRYQVGEGVPKDAAEAFKWMKQAAHNDYTGSMITTAMYCLALMYEQGEGTPRDLSAAHRLFMQAAVDNHQPDAAFRVGQMYEKGDGVPQDDRKAAEFYANEYHFYMAPDDPRYVHPEKYPHGVINYGNPQAGGVESLLNLWAHGRGFPDEKNKTVPGYRNPDGLIKSLESWVKTAKAQFYAGEIYYQGKLVQKDIAQAAGWFSKAAAQGSPEAMNRIGEMWAVGMNGTPDPKEAARWYRKAAAKGLAAAQYNLGLSYVKAEGVSSDAIEAWKWLQLAAKQRFLKAGEERDRVQAAMSDSQLKEARARAEQFETAH